MLMSAMTTSVTRWGAALQGARMPFNPPWMSEPSGTGLPLAYSAAPLALSTPRTEQGWLGHRAGLAVTSDAPCVAVVAAGAGVVFGTGTGIGAGTGNGATRRIQAINGLLSDNRKQQYVHKTRVTANGGGAPGPEPEREQALQAKASQIPFRPRTRETRVRGLVISRGPGPTPLGTEEDQEAKGDGTDAVARRLHKRHERDGDRGNAG